MFPIRRRDLRWLLGLLGVGLRLRGLPLVCLLTVLTLVPREWRQCAIAAGTTDLRACAMFRMELGYLATLGQYAREMPPTVSADGTRVTHGQALPRLPHFLHTLFLRSFGPPGLIAADLLVAFAAYIVWTAIFRLLVGDSAWAVVWSCALLTGIVGALANGLREGFGFLYFAAPPTSKFLCAGFGLAALVLVLSLTPRGRMRFAMALGSGLFVAAGALHLRFEPSFWTLRYPRPFVTGLFFGLWLLGLLMSWRQPQRSLPRWLAVLAAAGLVRSDVYSFGALALATAVVWFRGRPAWRQILLHIGAGVVLVAPYLWAQSRFSPEIYTRLGALTYRRTDALEITRSLLGPLGHWGVAMAIALLLCVGAVRWVRGGSCAWVFGFLAATMSLSVPLQIFAVGKAVQAWHYFFLIPMQIALATSIAMIVFFTRAPSVQRRLRVPVGRWLAGAGCIVGNLALLPRELPAFTAREMAISKDFSEVARQLDSLHGPRVLGSWVPQARNYWSAFHGEVWNPDPFTTTLPTATLELRLLQLAHWLSWDETELSQNLRAAERWRNPAFWHLGHYQYARKRPASPLERDQPDTASPFQLPAAIIQRLCAQYATIPVSRPCDILVVETRDAPGSPPAGFDETFSNRSYRVFVRRD